MKRKIFFMFCVWGIPFLLSDGNFAFSQEVTVSNVSFSMRDSDVVVHYDLNGPADGNYQVRLILRRESQSFFKMFPKDIEGDVGTGAFSGRNREIVWRLYEDVPHGLDGDDYYFEVNAALQRVEKGGGASWLYYVGGALVAGGAVVYFGTDLFKKSGGSQLPTPPLRP
ncbi:MAG TPA: hypothetical protein VLX91_06550 [Candidatus Acidoferrales bacterium]|nr:hypothetical protein [Candidatus Acidoferrales bacterium]